MRPLPPATVEAMRAASEPRDATLISVLAYAGLRPQEALGLRWRHVGERTLTVYASKTGQRRSVRLLAPLREDLTRWRERPADPDEADAGVPGRRRAAVVGGGVQVLGEPGVARTQARGRHARPARVARSAAPRRRPVCRSASPYTLRHSFCSLLLHEGRSVIYVARQMGHDAKLTLGTYGHVIDELEDAPRMPARGRDPGGPRARVSLVCHGRRAMRDAIVRS